jgi:gluconate 2-dehydrogenase gamma chain
MQDLPIAENSASESLPTRREAIKVLSAVAASALAGGSVACAADRDVPAGAMRFFTPEETRLLEAVCEQIIPADKDPGAKDARVVAFIDRQLLGPYERHQVTYRAGLKALEETCRRQFAKPFEALAWDDQTKILTALEAGHGPKDLWKSPGSAEFFHLVMDHTKQGFYGGPENGGNYHYASFKMLGLDDDFRPLH